MASRPKEGRLKVKLAALAERDGCETPLAWVVNRIENGTNVTALAREVAATELPDHPAETFSRNWFSMVINKMPVPEGVASAKDQIAQARREAAHALVDEAMDIADERVATTADVQRNRLRTETRLKIAGWWNPDYSEKAKVSVALDIGALHLSALRARAVQANTVPQLESGEVDYEIVNG
jgi:hypothetical protein